jgi:hypothetical protein
VPTIPSNRATFVLFLLLQRGYAFVVCRVSAWTSVRSRPPSPLSSAVAGELIFLYLPKGTYGDDATEESSSSVEFWIFVGTSSSVLSIDLRLSSRPLVTALMLVAALTLAADAFYATGTGNA